MKNPIKVLINKLSPKTTGIVEIYEDSDSEFRFRVKGINGEIVASSESYTRREDAVRGFMALDRILSGSIKLKDLT